MIFHYFFMSKYVQQKNMSSDSSWKCQILFSEVLSSFQFYFYITLLLYLLWVFCYKFPEERDFVGRFFEMKVNLALWHNIVKTNYQRLLGTFIDLIDFILTEKYIETKLEDVNNLHCNFPTWYIHINKRHSLIFPQQETHRTQNHGQLSQILWFWMKYFLEASTENWMY